MKDSFVLYTKWRKQIDLLSKEQKAELLDLIFDYAEAGDCTTDDPVVDMLMSVITDKMDEDAARYEAVCKRNKANGSKGGRPKAEETKSNPENPAGLFGCETNHTEPRKADYDDECENDLKTLSHTAPPSREEVLKEITAKGYKTNVDAFLSHYGSQNWLKSNGLPVTDWREALRSWTIKDSVFAQRKKKPAKKADACFDQHDYDFDELTRRAKVI